jgi:hypothetical protein
MASQILRTGKVTVVGENYPEQEVDFERDSALTKQLTSTARWGETGVSPTDNIRTWATEMHKLAGAHPGKVIMDPLAATLFLDDEKLTKNLDNRRQMGGEAQLFGAATGAQGEEAVYLGSYGQFEFWQYSAIYTDDDGTVQNFMPDYTVLMGAPGMAEGIRTYGAILDTHALMPMSRFPKEWDQEDPSVRYLMTQSSPLPVLGRADATMSITVR